MSDIKTDKCKTIRGDVFKYISKCKEQFDFIFADPPYALPELESIPDKIFEYNLAQTRRAFRFGTWKEPEL